MRRFFDRLFRPGAEGKENHIPTGPTSIVDSETARLTPPGKISQLTTEIYKT